MRADNVSIRADVDQVRADDDPGRADDDSGRSGIVGGAGGFVHGEEIDVGTGPAVLQTVSGKGVGVSPASSGVQNAKGRPPLDTRRHHAAA
ncbi:MAG: hypothetical protein ACREX8_00845 [Gammaproteobacteria bacterium]